MTWEPDSTGGLKGLRLGTLRILLFAEASRRLRPYDEVLHPHTFQLRFIVPPIDASYCIDAPMD